MTLDWLAAALVKNGPLVIIAAIFLKTYIDDTNTKREERREDRQLQKESNQKLIDLNEKFAVSTNGTSSKLVGLSEKLEVHSTSSGASLAEIKQGVRKIQEDVTVLNTKVDNIIIDNEKDNED